MKRLRLYNVEIPIGSSDKALYRAVLRRLGVDATKLANVELTKRALDTRKKQARWNCTVDVTPAEAHADAIFENVKEFRNVIEAPEVPPLEFPTGKEVSEERPVIVGTGPAGLFAAYVLAKQGYRPIVLERGIEAIPRLRQIGKFNSGNADLDQNVNTQFGEGGAGTFSDGKLYTRKNKDPHLTNVLKVLVEHGAPEEILVDAAPHIGTDQLAPVIVKIREAIVAMGGDVLFSSAVEEIFTENGKITGLRVNSDRFDCQAVILATGHSARNVYNMCRAAGVKLEAKPFQFGVRIEHPQSFIDDTQHGKFAGNIELGAADYSLACAKNPDLHEVHSFCMCPGGMIVPAVDTGAELVTNGMSFSLRNMPYANAGLVSTLYPKDFGGEEDPLAGIEYQRQYERMAYQAGGGGFVVPAQPASDFLSNLNLKRELPGSYPRGRRYVELASILPERFTKALAYALRDWERSMPGFAGHHGILHAIESRGSCPVRIPRDRETRESVTTAGLYPTGEGAGYAGGIISAALDGIHSAAAIIAKYAPPVSA